MRRGQTMAHLLCKPSLRGEKAGSNDLPICCIIPAATLFQLLTREKEAAAMTEINAAVGYRKRSRRVSEWI